MPFSAVSLYHQIAEKLGKTVWFIRAIIKYTPAVHPKRAASHFALFLLFCSHGSSSNLHASTSLFFFCWLHFLWRERLTNDTAEVKELWLIAALLGLRSGGRFHFSLSGLLADVVAFSPDLPRPEPPSTRTPTHPVAFYLKLIIHAALILQSPAALL